MRKFRLAVTAILTLCIGASALFGGATAAAQKKKGPLPPGFQKLSLSPEQIEKIHAIQAKHREKLKDLKKAYNDQRKAQKDEQEAVLTEEQKKLLDENRNRFKAKVKTRIKKVEKKPKDEEKKSDKE